jgi:hypothetical protein
VSDDTFWGLSAIGWTAIMTMLTAGLLIAAVLAALYAAGQVKIGRQQAAEARAAEQESSRPYVVVTVEPGLASPQLFDLLIRNIGKRPAVEVSITLDPAPIRASEPGGFELAKIRMLNEPIAMIAPGQEFRTFYDSHIQRKNREDLPSVHHVALRYKDTSGHQYRETAVLDLDAMKGALFTSVKTIHDIGKSLAEIEKVLKGASVLGRSGSLTVDAAIESRDERDERLARDAELEQLSLGRNLGEWFLEQGGGGGLPAELPPSRVVYGSDAWELLAANLSAGAEGELFLGGNPTDAQIQAFETALTKVIDSKALLAIDWGPFNRGSWWRRFRIMLRKRFGETDLDTTKRAAEAYLLDQQQAPAAKDYSEALATLMAASESIDHVYILTKNVAFLKTQRDGKSVVLGRLLTSAEVPLYESGRLNAVLAEPEAAYGFITKGMIEDGSADHALEIESGARGGLNKDDEVPGPPAMGGATPVS